MLSHNITNLVCIGGDGSLTGASMFREEWPSLVHELTTAGRISIATRGTMKEATLLYTLVLCSALPNHMCSLRLHFYRRKLYI